MDLNKGSDTDESSVIGTDESSVIGTIEISVKDTVRKLQVINGWGLRREEENIIHHSFKEADNCFSLSKIGIIFMGINSDLEKDTRWFLLIDLIKKLNDYFENVTNTENRLSIIRNDKNCWHFGLDIRFKQKSFEKYFSEDNFQKELKEVFDLPEFFINTKLTNINIDDVKVRDISNKKNIFK